MTSRERARRLKKAIEKIEYWHVSNQRAAHGHRKRRLRQLHQLGIQLSTLRKCINVF